jgi:hypothetical protein
MLDLDPHQFGDDKPKCMEYEPIGALFHGFESLFAIASLNPNPLKRDKQDPDPRQGDADPQHCL